MMGDELRKEWVAVLLRLYGPSSGSDASSGRSGRLLDAWKSAESHRIGGFRPLSW
jgi:hypothetical protein